MGGSQRYLASTGEGFLDRFVNRSFHEVAQIGTGESRGAARQALGIDRLANRAIAQKFVQNVLTRTCIRRRHEKDAIKSSWTSEGGINGPRYVRCAENQYTLVV